MNVAQMHRCGLMALVVLGLSVPAVLADSVPFPTPDASQITPPTIPQPTSQPEASRASKPKAKTGLPATKSHARAKSHHKASQLKPPSDAIVVTGMNSAAFPAHKEGKKVAVPAKDAPVKKTVK